MSRALLSAVQSYANLKSIDNEVAFSIIMSAMIAFEDEMSTVCESRGEYYHE